MRFRCKYCGNLIEITSGIKDMVICSHCERTQLLPDVFECPHCGGSIKKTDEFCPLCKCHLKSKFIGEKQKDKLAYHYRVSYTDFGVVSFGIGVFCVLVLIFTFLFYYFRFPSKNEGCHVLGGILFVFSIMLLGLSSIGIYLGKKEKKKRPDTSTITAIGIISNLIYLVGFIAIIIVKLKRG